MHEAAAQRGELLGYSYVYEPGASGRTLLLLHGTGGNEMDLLPLARALAPQDARLGIRGNVLEHGMPRFFRRIREGVLDVPDLKTRAGEVANVAAEAARAHSFDAARVVALGYSNGANLAVGMLLERPTTLAGALLLRAMVPYEPDSVPDLAGKRVLIAAGARDPYSASPASDTLANILRRGGAEVEVAMAEAGHEIAQADLAAARRWLA